MGLFLRVVDPFSGWIEVIKAAEKPQPKASTEKSRGCLRAVMVKAMDCGIVVSEFVLQSRYYVHFRANTLGKGMNSLILPAMG